MKSLFKLGLIATGSALALPASGALTVETLESGNDFYDLVATMTNNKSDLLADHVGGKPYTQFVWDNVNETFIADRGQAGYPGGSGSYDEFKAISPDASTWAVLETLYLGYIGNESNDLNTFGFESGGMDYDLATYRKEGNPYLDSAPVAKLYNDEGMGEFMAQFYHIDQSIGRGKVFADNPEYFTVFEGSLAGRDTWIFTVDDRGDSLIDYDDGIFVAWAPEGGYIVPEPSTVGAIAALGLIGLALVRRRRKS